MPVHVALPVPVRTDPSVPVNPAMAGDPGFLMPGIAKDFVRSGAAHRINRTSLTLQGQPVVQPDDAEFPSA